ncbi:hypothetical protein [Spiroplasma sp. AdecLV25b]|uniref:hypothetical protein n=1 Tax=Spiroplasma sp. AdecLV25b TaxID=3027162 RepID=UPI0027E0E1CA|nr:hypothetical protein [Spiroplasma sp. AdecLV25b]
MSVCYENNLLEFDSAVLKDFLISWNWVLKEHNKNIYEQKLIAELISIFNLNKNVKFLKILKENSEKSKIIFDQNFSNLQVSDVIKENWQQIIQFQDFNVHLNKKWINIIKKIDIFINWEQNIKRIRLSLRLCVNLKK